MDRCPPSPTRPHDNPEAETGETAGNADQDEGTEREDPTSGRDQTEDGTEGRRTWRARRPTFAAPGIERVLRLAADRRSLVGAIRSTPAEVAWLAYSGSALAVGFWRGWPQWIRDGVAFLVKEHPTLTDTYSLTCYGLAAGVLLLDYRARAWIPPLAWAARIPSACLVAGVVMYGDPTPISQMTL